MKNKNKNKCKKITNNDDDNNNDNNNNNNNKTIKRYIPLSPRPPVHRLDNAVSDDDDEFMQLQKM